MIFVTIGLIASYTLGFALSIYVDVPTQMDDTYDYIQRNTNEKS